MLLSLLLAAQVLFGSPVHYPITLAGNFAEPRPSHFHGGIDVKTDQREGKPMYSLGSGHVSQVTIGLYGFGNALWVTYPEGYTAVYCHLKRFSGPVARRLRQAQYRAQRSEGAFAFKPHELPVARGELVAFSGNTGHSQAPHLHLELRDNRTGAMRDPLQFMQTVVEDSLPPQAHGFMATPIEGQGTFGGSQRKQVFGFPRYDLATRFTAWGKVGFALWANDYSHTTYNNYGVRRTELFVDGRRVFMSDADGIPADQNLAVNYWGDYHHYLRSHVWYMRQWLLPGLSLPVFETDDSRGVVDFSQERDYHVAYVLTDYKGNQSRYTFTVTGKRVAIKPRAAQHAGRTLLWARDNHYQLPGMEMIIRRGLLADDTEIEPRRQSGVLSGHWRFAPMSLPLMGDGRLRLRLSSRTSHPDHVYLACRLGSDKYMGSRLLRRKDSRGREELWVEGRIRDLSATYFLAEDNTPPSINLVGYAGAQGQVTIGMTDSGSGIKSYHTSIDGRFVAFQPVERSAWLRCKLADTPIARTGKKHRLVVKATDMVGNERQLVQEFVY